MSNAATERLKWKVKLQRRLSGLGGIVSRPVHKLAQEATYGILSSGSLQLASIGRALREPVELHQTEKRLSRMLCGHGELAGKIEDFQLSQIAPLVTKGMVLGIDPGDLNRNGAPKSEYRGRVRDGSVGETVGGYPLISVVAHDAGRGTALPVLTRLYSCVHPDFESENTEILSVMEAVETRMDHKPLWAIDRGGDRGRLWDGWITQKRDVLVRVTDQRHWLWRGRGVSAQNIAKALPLKHAGALRRGKKRKIRFGITQVRLKDHPDAPLWMIVVRHGGREPLVLVTTRAVRGRLQGQGMIRAYMDRWACEEGYRFTKQGFGAERVMARSYAALKNLVALACLAWAFLACEDRARTLAARDMRLKPGKPPAFLFYSILAGWRNLFADAKTALYNSLRGSGPPPLPLFNVKSNQVELL